MPDCLEEWGILTVLVDTDMLTAEEILSILERGRESELHGVVHPCTPAFVLVGSPNRARLPAIMMSTSHTHAMLKLPNVVVCDLHLEPVSRAVIARD